MNTGNKRLAQASPLDPVWGVGLRADDPRTNDPRQWRGKHLLGDALSAVREAIRDQVRPGRHTPPSLADSALPSGLLEFPRFCQRRSRARHPRPALVKVLFRSFFIYFSDAPADSSRESLTIASAVGPGLALLEHGPCLVGRTVTLDDVSFTTIIAIQLEGAPLHPTDA